MARTEWAARRYSEVLRTLETEFGIAPSRVGRRRNLLQLGEKSVRLGFGHGQLANQRGIKGFPKETTETFYLEVPAPAVDTDIVVAVLGETELVFEASAFKRIAGPAAEHRYLPNLFRDRRDGRYWARVADHDLNYPLDEFVRAWPSSSDGARVAGTFEPPRAAAREPEPDDLYRDFKPQNSGDYAAHVEGQVLTKTRLHERLVSEFGLWVAEQGFRPSTVEYPRDLVLRRGDVEILVEAKVLYGHNATQAVRAAIGQLLTYQHLLHSGKIELLALFSEPIGDEFINLLGKIQIAAIWRDRDQWSASALAEKFGIRVS